MNRYEILMLANPSITKDEASLVEKNLESLVKDAKGEVLSFERWGKCRLAYPVRKNEYGVYFLTRFESTKNAQLFDSIKELFAVKHEATIMRHVLVKLDPKQSLDYKRPQTVEEAPEARDVDKFLRDNKMQGLVSKKEESKEADTAEKVVEKADTDQAKE